jgi:toxin HigB-1
MFLRDMIRSFRSKALRLFAGTGDARKLSVPNAAKIRRILAQLDAAIQPEDLDLPGYRFHALKGERRGFYAVNASANFRITFCWDGQDAINVDLEDYH